MEKAVKVTSQWQGGMRVDATAGNHTVIIDQPAGLGGKDEGANPMAYSLFALGGCLGTIAAIVANQERIDLRGFSVTIEGDFDVDYLLGKTKEGRAGFTDIRVKASIDADMSPQEKEAFLEKVDSRCPISDNLINTTPVTFEVA